MSLGNLWDREEKDGLVSVCAIFLGAERSMQEREILLGYKEKTLSCRAGWGGGTVGSAAGLWLRCVPKNTPAGKRLFLAARNLRKDDMEQPCLHRLSRAKPRLSFWGSLWA